MRFKSHDLIYQMRLPGLTSCFIFDRLACVSFATSLLHVSESLAQATNLLYDKERPLKRREDSLPTGSNRNKK